MADAQFFTTPEGTEMVIITRARYEALLDAEEEIGDIEAAEEGRASIEAEGGMPIDVSKAIAEGTHPIVAWRKHRGMTQAQLAEASDLTQGAITRLERTDPGSGRAETLEAIAKALDAPRWTLDASSEFAQQTPKISLYDRLVNLSEERLLNECLAHSPAKGEAARNEVPKLIHLLLEYAKEDHVTAMAMQELFSGQTSGEIKERLAASKFFNMISD